MVTPGFSVLLPNEPNTFIGGLIRKTTVSKRRSLLKVVSSVLLRNFTTPKATGPYLRCRQYYRMSRDMVDEVKNGDYLEYTMEESTSVVRSVSLEAREGSCVV